MNEAELRFFLGEKLQGSLIDALNASSCDEMAEIDLNHDTYTHLYHVLGKYFVASSDGKYSSVYSFAREHIVHPDDVEAYIDLMDPKNIKEKLPTSPVPYFRFAEFRYRTQNGGYRWVKQCVIGGKAYGFKKGIYRFYAFDINNKKIREAGGQDDAHIDEANDPITDLLTEKAFFNAAQKRIDESRRGKWWLLTLDIEHFKLFDEWYGRKAGDEFLAKLGGLIQDLEARLGCLGGYLGQDDFVILLRPNLPEVNKLFEEIRSLSHTFGSSVGFLPSFGIAEVEKGISAVTAYDRASIALKEAQRTRDRRIRFYHPSIHAKAEQDSVLVSDFLKALQNDEITFFLQPQIRISTRQIVGAESLARWIKKDGTMVLPGNFVPALEEYGFITDLDRIVWDKVCAWLRKRLDAKKPVIPVSVNVSRVDLVTIDVPAYLEGLIKKYRLPHKLLKIEITESAYAESWEVVRNCVDTLRAKGFIVLMDDFGSGYSSLNMLSSLNVDVVKLDALFLNLKDEAAGKGIHILESIVNMTKNLALPIVVEGVETKEQSEFLESLGCRYAQGFYFYRPMKVSDFESLIEKPRILDERGFVAKTNEQFRLREFMDQTIYSDSMLNNLLGPVAIYQWHGEDVDIIRFNEQFYHAVDTPDFDEKLRSIQKVMPGDEGNRLLETLQKAYADRLNGGRGVFHFYKLDGTIAEFLIHFYYLGDSEGGKRFYGSAAPITEYTDLKDKFTRLGNLCPYSILFLRRKRGDRLYELACHGLEKEMGIDGATLEAEHNDGSIGKRHKKDEQAKIIAALENQSTDDAKPHSFLFNTKFGRKMVPLVFEIQPIREKTSNYCCMLIIRKP